MDSTSTLASAKADVFGKDPTLGTDGQPLERGVGSPWHRSAHIAKAHYYAADAWALCDGLVANARAGLAIAEKISAAVKASIEAAAAAKSEQFVIDLPAGRFPPSVPPSPATDGTQLGTTGPTPIVPAENPTLSFAGTPGS